MLEWLRESSLGRWFGSSPDGGQLEKQEVAPVEEFDVTLLPPEELDRCQRAFAFFDKDKSGYLEGDEVTRVRVRVRVRVKDKSGY